jgi:hypothetical protein
MIGAMSRRARNAPPERATRTRELFEQLAVGAPAGASPLRIDEDGGVIFRVKVLGRFSRNNHGLSEAENGTDYGPSMRRAIAEYEGKKVKCNHPSDRTNPGKERPVEDTFGVLRNCVIESDESGEPAIWADLHCLTTHPMYPRVVEDVKKGLGVYGLSHNATSRRERFDRASRRLVIEELATVRSVDLVDKPATNRNLWESERPMKSNLRDLIESRLPKWSGPRRKWARKLLEDDAMAAPLGEGADAGDAGAADPDDALKGGFDAACRAVLDGDMSADEKIAKLRKLLKAHEKLTQDDEPEPPADDDGAGDDLEESVGDGSKNQDGQKGAMEFYDAWDRPSRHKKESESDELRLLRGEKAVRQLCESLGVSLSDAQVEAGAAIAAGRRKSYVESFQGRPGLKTPKSAPPGGRPPQEGKAKDRLESEGERKASVADDLAALRG